MRPDFGYAGSRSISDLELFAKTVQKSKAAMHQTELDKKWAALWTERDSTFRKIVTLLANESGHGEFSQLDIAARTHLAQLARQQIRDWDKATASGEAIAQTPLQQLLSAHQDISKAILKIRDMDVGLPWGDEEHEESK